MHPYFCSVFEEIEKAASIIRQGGIILYPTDTIWGLGCDPKNDAAVEKIIQLKKRDENKSLIVLVNAEQLLNQYVSIIPEICYDLVDLADGPLTIIYPQGKGVSKAILGDDGSIAIRMTKHDFCFKLMQKLRSGLVSTSANFSGQPAPKKFSDISKDIINGVDYVVNLQHDQPASKPSQIIKVGAKGEIKIIRK